MSNRILKYGVFFAAVALVLAAFQIANAAVCVTSTGSQAGDEFIGYLSGNEKVGTPFTLSAACDVESIVMNVNQIGAPDDGLQYCIYNTTGSSPSTSVVCTADAVSIQTSGYQYATGTVASPSTISAGNYWLVAETYGTPSTTNYYDLGLMNSTPFGGYKTYVASAWLTGAGGYAATFYILDDGSTGGGGGGSATTTIAATSTIEQSQQNLSTAFYLFMFAFFGMIWLLRKH